MCYGGRLKYLFPYIRSVYYFFPAIRNKLTDVRCYQAYPAFSKVPAYSDVVTAGISALMLPTRCFSVLTTIANGFCFCTGILQLNRIRFNTAKHGLLPLPPHTLYILAAGVVSVGVCQTLRTNAMLFHCAYFSY